MTFKCFKTLFTLLLAVAHFDLSSAFQSNTFIRSGPPKEAQKLHAVEDSGNGFASHSRNTEFNIDNDKPAQQSFARIERIAIEKAAKERFVEWGDDLWDLRAELKSLSEELVKHMLSSSSEPLYSKKSETEIVEKIHNLEQKDANIVYALEMDAVDKALYEGRIEDADKHKKQVEMARSHLPQFNLEGLWVGQYGVDCYELVNITYSGNALTARKVTSDGAVPVGEITFKADLSPTRPIYSPSFNDDVKEELENVVLEKTSEKWGTKEFQRFRGKGQIAEEGFVDTEWLEGQLILVTPEHFQFSWIPENAAVFFTRPTPELQLKMLRAAEDKNEKKKQVMLSDLENFGYDASKDHLFKCLDATVRALEDGSLGDTTETCLGEDNWSDGICCFE